MKLRINHNRNVHNLKFYFEIRKFLNLKHFINPQLQRNHTFKYAIVRS